MLFVLFQSLNQIVLWDKIIRRGENARFNLRDITPKYKFLDDGEFLKFVNFFYFKCEILNVFFNVDQITSL